MACGEKITLDLKRLSVLGNYARSFPVTGKWRKSGAENNPRRVVLCHAGTWSRNMEGSLGLAVFTVLYSPF